MSFFSIKKIHFIGIGGHGLSALARLALSLGMEVTGSDLEDSPIVEELKEAGARIKIGQAGENLEKGLELVVYTSAARENENAEMRMARQKGLPLFSYPEVLGMISQERETIAVAGTNGKTTVTILLGLMLAAGGREPLVIAGGNLEGKHGGGFRFGQGPFVVEACEAFGNFLNIKSTHLIITNIAADHLDYYKDLDDIVFAFQKMADKIEEGGRIIWNADDVNSHKLKLAGRGLIIKNFGIEGAADFKAEKIETGADFQKFTVGGREYQLNIPGRFNIYNALAAAAMALSLGVGEEAIKKALENFKGSWRRFEILGKYRGATIVSDYGHHPAGVAGTIEAARQKFPSRRVVLVFHPHHKWRTRFLFNDFIEAFLKSDVVILNEIWAAPGREPREDNISSKDLVEELQGRGFSESYFGKDLEETRRILDSIVKPGDVVLMMGAGFIYRLAEKLIRPPAE
ncbi:MAG: UDP-N-acetylmuramate--L-alanine ligase [Candidatus Magasanikbacteria bacterium]|nr:UDP-N-acetylmuramate--L-alanine ligase [Candidatus Magasanikbacteria bacterium]